MEIKKLEIIANFTILLLFGITPLFLLYLLSVNAYKIGDCYTYQNPKLASWEGGQDPSIYKIEEIGVKNYRVTIYFKDEPPLKNMTDEKVPTNKRFKVNCPSYKETL